MCVGRISKDLTHPSEIPGPNRTAQVVDHVGHHLGSLLTSSKSQGHPAVFICTVQIDWAALPAEVLDHTQVAHTSSAEESGAMLYVLCNVQVSAALLVQVLHNIYATNLRSYVNGSVSVIELSIDILHTAHLHQVPHHLQVSLRGSSKDCAIGPSCDCMTRIHLTHIIQVLD